MHRSKQPLALAGSIAELEALDAERPSPHDDSGGRSLAPRSHPSRRGWWRRIRESSWAPLIARGAAIVGGLLLFAGIGVYSSEAHPGGVHVASQVAPGAPVSWLAPAPSGPSQAQAGSVNGPPEISQQNLSGMVPPASCSTPGALCEPDKKKEPPPGITKDGKVILNVAGTEALTRLPGVGERRAEAIVKLRERLKRFRRPADLLRVRGIGVRSLKRMLPHLVLDPPPKLEHEEKGPEKQPTPKQARD